MTRVMTNYLSYFITCCLIVLTCQMSFAASDPQIRAQQRAAEKQRNEQKKQRNTELREAQRSFKDFVKEQKIDLKEQLKEIDEELKIRKIEINADKQAANAMAETQMQQKMMSMLMGSGGKMDEKALEGFKQEAIKHAEQQFVAKKEAAKRLHDAKMDATKSKHELLSQRDADILSMAEELGLRKHHQAIMASPIGDSLSKNEQRWNERETKEVARINERNQKLLREYMNGDKFRAWELANAEEDFKLEWEKKEKLNKVDSVQGIFGMLQMFGMQGGKAENMDMQGLMNKAMEMDKEKQLIEIEYNKIRDINRLKRRKERKALIGR